MVDKKQVMISVIIPVYNSEKYLRKCIDSVLAQSYTNFELILVNDGSKDRSGEICDEYAEKNERVRVFHEKNSGVSNARNLGLDKAKGEWIAFIDSDDWVTPTYLNNFINDIDDKSMLIMHGRYTNNNDRDSEEKLEFIKTYNRASLFEELQISPNGQPWSKLFKNSIIQKNKVRFNPNVSLSEDTLFILKYISYIDVIKYRNIFHYNYIYIAESLSSTVKVNCNSNLIGFETINKILYDDYHLKSLREFPTLRITYFGFFYRAVKAFCVNGYNKKERIDGYKDLKNMFLFSFESQEYSNNSIMRFAFTQFKKNNYNIFDFIMNKRHNQGYITSFIYSFYKKQKQNV